MLTNFVASDTVRTSSNEAEYKTRCATWLKLHRECCGAEVPMLPLTAKKLVKVTNTFKGKHFRSCANYLSAIKRRHTESKYKWSTLLSHTWRACRASATRGFGQPRVAKSFTWCKLRACRASCLLGIKMPAHVSSIASHLLF